LKKTNPPRKKKRFLKGVGSDGKIFSCERPKGKGIEVGKENSPASVHRKKRTQGERKENQSEAKQAKTLWNSGGEGGGPPSEGAPQKPVQKKDFPLWEKKKG